MKRVIAAGTKTHGKILIDKHNFIDYNDPDEAGGALALIRTITGGNNKVAITTDHDIVHERVKIMYVPLGDPFWRTLSDDELWDFFTNDRFWGLNDDTDSNIPPAL